MPALGTLTDKVKKRANKRGYLLGLDGRRLHVRSDHAALNTLLQSAGALICKKWITDLDRRLREDEGLTHGWGGDYAFNAWVHDEVQVSVREGLEETVGKACVTSAVYSGEFFNFGCPVTADFDVGRSWAETH